MPAKPHDVVEVRGIHRVDEIKLVKIRSFKQPGPVPGYVDSMFQRYRLCPGIGGIADMKRFKPARINYGGDSVVPEFFTKNAFCKRGAADIAGTDK